MVYGRAKTYYYLHCSGSHHSICVGTVCRKTPVLPARNSAVRSCTKSKRYLTLKSCCVSNLAEEVTKSTLDDSGDQLKLLKNQLAKSEHELANIGKAIREVGGSEFLHAELKRLESQQIDLKYQIEQSRKFTPTMPKLPPIEQLREMARAAFMQLPRESQEFSMLMKRMIDKIVVYPVRFAIKKAAAVSGAFHVKLALLPALTELPAVVSISYAR